MRRLLTSTENTAAQLAAGPSLLAGLEETGMPALRWYHIAERALLLGSAQSVSAIDPAACAKAGVTVHRRKSGGGAVFGDETLFMLDLALPRDHPLFLDDITRSYQWIGDVWSTALSGLGLVSRPLSIGEARADTQTLDPLLKPVCFGGLSPFETVVGERKVVGLAQLRRRAGALFQCGVYLHWDPQHTAALIAGTVFDHARLTELLTARVAGLDELLGRAVSPMEVIDAFEAALEYSFGLVPADADWAEVERTARSTAMADYAAIRLQNQGDHD